MAKTLYSNVLQLVAHREKLKLELRALGEVIGSEEPSRGATKVRSLLTALRNATFSIIHSAEAWSQSQHVDAVSFAWQGRDYLATMCNDLDFVADSPSLVASVGAPANLLRNNPLMLPRTIEQACSQPEDLPNASLPTSSEGERLRHAEALLVEAMRRSQLSRTEHPPPGLSDWTERARAQLAELRNGPIALGSAHTFSLQMTESFFGARSRKLTRVSPVEAYAWTRRRRKRHLPSNQRLKQKLEQLQRPAGPLLLPPVARVSPSCSRLAELARPRVNEESASTPNPRRKPRIRRRNRSPPEFGNPHVRLCAEDLLALGQVDKQPSDAAARIGAAVLTLLAEGADVPEDVAWPRVVSQLASSREVAAAACTRLHAVEPRSVPLFKARTLAMLLQKINIGNRFIINNIAVPLLSPEALVDGETTQDHDFADALFRLADWAWGVINASQEFHAARVSARVKANEHSSTLNRSNLSSTASFGTSEEGLLNGRILHTAWWQFHDGEGPACLVTVIAPATSGDDIRDNVEHRLVVKAYDPAASAEARLALDTMSVKKLRGHIPVRIFVKTDLLARLELVKSAGRVKLRIRNGSRAGCAVPAPGQPAKNAASLKQRTAKCNEPTFLSDSVASPSLCAHPASGEGKMHSMSQRKMTLPSEKAGKSNSLGQQSLAACTLQPSRREPSVGMAPNSRFGISKGEVYDVRSAGPAPALQFGAERPVTTAAQRIESDIKDVKAVSDLATPAVEDISDYAGAITDATAFETQKGVVEASHAPKVELSTALVEEPHDLIEDAVDSVQRTRTSDYASRVNEQVLNKKEYDEDFLDDEDDSRMTELRHHNHSSNATETGQLQLHALSESQQLSAQTDPSGVYGLLRSAPLQRQPLNQFEAARRQNLVEAHNHILENSSNKQYAVRARDAFDLEFKVNGTDPYSMLACGDARIDGETDKEEGNAADDEYNDDFEEDEN